jgi:chemotaxis regulatin CheY-phosphate phosphatase CheZ
MATLSEALQDSFAALQEAINEVASLTDRLNAAYQTASAAAQRAMDQAASAPPVLPAGAICVTSEDLTALQSAFSGLAETLTAAVKRNTPP